MTKDNGDLRMVVLFGNDDCSRILRIEVTGTDSEAVGHEAPVCLDWSRLWVNTYIHILKTDRCTIKALPLQNYLQRRAFLRKIVTGRIGYIRVENLLEKIKDAQWLVFTSKNAVAGFAYNMGSVNFLLVLRLR